MADGTRRAVLHASLLRPKLLAGGERQALIWNFGAAFLLVLATRTVIGILAAVVLSAIVQGILVALAKRDAQMIEVANRGLKYQHFYGTAPTLDAEPAQAHTQKQPPITYLVYAFQSLIKGKKQHA